MSKAILQTQTQCYHCGENCKEEAVSFDQKNFCCPGCKLVYEVLSENNLCNYYQLQDSPGQTQQNPVLGERYAFLDNQEIANRLIRFRDADSVHLRFHIPSMHCSSCIWLLEHLNRLDGGILRSQTHFIQKEIQLVYDPSRTSLRKVVEKLHEIGYAPELNLNELEQKTKKTQNRSRIYKIGVAGFAFGNIMLLSFPEYFAGGVYHGNDFHKAFSYLNLFLSLPVFFYSASEFLGNALLSFRQRVVNIDFPIAVGIVAMFLRSIYEITTDSGPGYFDSMTGLVFFMLIGRNFQSKTYDWLSFDRDYKSYFPIAVSRLTGQKEEAVAVQDLRINDRLFIRNQEIIPADVILISDQAEIDYSFVSGESRPVYCEKGDRIYAGGRLQGSPAEVVVQKVVSHSYITQLWNQSSGKTEIKSGFQTMVNHISRWFVVVTLLIATLALLYWYPQDVSRAMRAFTSVLVIACACALALSAPFTFGNMLRILGKKGIYLKNAHVLEKLADVDTVLFDKTGTLTHAEQAEVHYTGSRLNEDLSQAIASLAQSSSHPLSRMLARHLQADGASRSSVYDVKEISGMGIEGNHTPYFIRLGSRKFLQDEIPDQDVYRLSEVGVQVNGEILGYFQFRNLYRSEAAPLIQDLKNDGYRVAVISGDHEHERPYLESLTGQKEGLKFDMQPLDKLKEVNRIQDEGRKAMMVGDGLNDAGALMHSHVGLALAENINNFTPGCDGILLSKNFGSIHRLIRFAKSGHRIIVISFIISLLYNAGGLWFAVQGTLSPVIAAILMPISTSSLVIYTVLASSLKAYRLGFKK